MTDEEYDEWYCQGYEAYFTGEGCPSGATRAQRSAWDDGHATGSEEDG